MAFVDSKKMLKDAQKHGYAVGAFNAENMEMVKAIIAAAEEVKAPVMIQTTPSTIRYASSAMFAAMVTCEAEAASVPVCLHLDHGSSYELAQECMNNGYSSVMIDGSKESFENNVTITKKVVALANEKNIPVEAELGKIGGKEDDLEGNESSSTDVKEAVDFVEQTKVSSLAIAIGTAHGFYKGEPKLDFKRLEELAQALDIPLVLHGASGIADEEVSKCVGMGICKVNFATELRVAFTDACKKLYQESPDTFDPKAYGNAGMQAVKALVMNRMKVCRCDHKA